MQEKSRGSKKSSKTSCNLLWYWSFCWKLVTSHYVEKKFNSHVMSQNKKRSLWQLESLKKTKPQAKKIVKGQLLSQCLHLEGTHYHGDDTIFLQLLN